MQEDKTETGVSELSILVPIISSKNVVCFLLIILSHSTVLLIRARNLFITILILFQLVHTSSCASTVFSFLAHMLTPPVYTEKAVHLFFFFFFFFVCWFVVLFIIFFLLSELNKPIFCSPLLSEKLPISLVIQSSLLCTQYNFDLLFLRFGRLMQLFQLRSHLCV